MNRIRVSSSRRAHLALTIFGVLLLTLLTACGGAGANGVSDADRAQNPGTFTGGSILAFLTFGPMVDIKSSLMFLGVFRRKIVAYLIILPMLMTLLIGIWVNRSTSIRLTNEPTRIDMPADAKIRP